MLYLVGDIARCPNCRADSQGHFFYPNRQMQCGIYRFMTTDIVQRAPDGRAWCRIVGSEYSAPASSGQPTPGSWPDSTPSQSPQASATVRRDITPPAAAASAVPGAPARAVWQEARNFGLNIPPFNLVPQQPAAGSLADSLSAMSVAPSSPGTMPGVSPLPAVQQAIAWACPCGYYYNRCDAPYCQHCGQVRQR